MLSSAPMGIILYGLKNDGSMPWVWSGKPVKAVDFCFIWDELCILKEEGTAEHGIPGIVLSKESPTGIKQIVSGTPPHFTFLALKDDGTLVYEWLPSWDEELDLQKERIKSLNHVERIDFDYEYLIAYKDNGSIEIIDAYPLVEVPESIKSWTDIVKVCVIHNDNEDEECDIIIGVKDDGSIMREYRKL